MALTNMEQIQVLLAEYNTLRAEVLQRISIEVQSITLGVPTLIAFLTVMWDREPKKRVNRMQKLAPKLLMVAVFIFAAGLVWGDWSVTTLTSRLREIEATVNKKAGERLLSWETDHGWGGLLYPRQISRSPTTNEPASK